MARRFRILQRQKLRRKPLRFRMLRLEHLEERSLLAANLVADLAPLGNANPHSIVSSGGKTFFVASDRTAGEELWRTDGSQAGTVRVKDVYSGAYGAYPRYLTDVGGTLFFRARDGSNGYELWKSDGTATGTILVKDIRSGTYGSVPRSLTAVGSRLFFVANDGTHGYELWKSDGTTTGTVLVKDIRLGSSGAYPRNLTNVNGTLFFTALDGTNGYELWKSDGTTNGTVLVKDIRSGAYGSYPNSLTNSGGTLFFSAFDATNGYELWKSNGTAAGTVLVQDVRAGVTSSYPRYLTDVNGTLFFRANDGTNGYELWKSNGTATGTTLVKDIRSGASGSYPHYLANVNGTLLFTAFDSTNGYELWKSDGSDSGTVLVKDIRSGSSGSYPHNPVAVNGTLFFSAHDGTDGYELWKSDGSAAGTTLVQDLLPGAYGSYPFYLKNIGGTLFFRANDGNTGYELWKSDGTAAGTLLVKDIRDISGSYPHGLTDVAGTLFFSANSGGVGAELWKTDGTQSGTVLVKDIRVGGYSSAPAYLTAWQSKLFLRASDGRTGPELWTSDGTTAGTVQVKDIRSGYYGSYPRYLTDVAGKLFFVANDGTHGSELWATDGTAGGTTLVTDIRAGVSGSYPHNLVNVNGTLFFTAFDSTNGYELWKSDGTSGGTTLVKDIRTGAYSSYPSYLTNVNGTLFFRANNGTNGYELWKSDGTSGGTVLVKDIRSGSANATPSLLTAVNDTLFFRANDGTNGYELWKSDGSTAGTVLVKDIRPGSANSYPAYLTNLNGTLLFRANDGSNGYELWKSNGTSSGTVLVKDIRSGSSNSYPRNLKVDNGQVYFRAFDDTHGYELWRSDGTSRGTVLLQDIWPGSSGAYPTYLTPANGQLFFSADDNAQGRELWAFQETVGTLGFSAATSSVAENGGALTIAVQVSTGGAPLDSDVSVQVAVTGGTATNGTDYAAFSTTTVTFPRGTVDGTTKTVTLTPSDDNFAEGDETVVLTLQTVSGPGAIDSAAASHTVTLTDSDTAEIIVSPTSGLATTEAGGAATFTVRLRSQPTADVTVSLSSNNTAEGTVAPASLTFTAANWSAVQTVTVTGVNDAVVDGNVAYTIVTAPAVSGDTQYSGLNAVDVSVTNQDNDTASIAVSPTSGLVTSEAGGAATFTVRLTSQPTADVTVGLSTDNPAEGTAAPASLTFTAADWNVAQTVTVTGVDDMVVDGNVAYTIVTAPAVSSDSQYSGRNATDVSVTNQDNDTAGITVNPTSGLVTTEAGGSATFTVQLTSQPTAAVTVGLSSDNAREGTVAPASLTFTAADWNAPQTVTVTGVDDAIADGNVAYSIITAPAASSDGQYSGRDAADVSVTNQDNDTAGITVTPTSGLVTTEAGGTATFTVQLTSQPTAAVTVSLSTDNAVEGTVAPKSLAFTAANWNVAQTVTVTGADDAVVDGTVAYTIVTTPAVSSDSQYNGRNAADVSVTNQDNDTAGITVSPTSGLVTTEAGGTATFTVQLTSQPTAAVTVSLSTDNAVEGTVAPTSLTFTAADWNVAQTVTVTGIDDVGVDGNIAYTVVSAPAVSNDRQYDGFDPADVSVTNQDDDAPGITVSQTSGLVTTEAGGSASFTVQLASRPTAAVTVALSSDNAAEGTVAPASLTFTTADWNVAQTVSVTGADDALVDGDVAYTIVTAAAVSNDSQYSGLDAADVSVTNQDNDAAGITVTPTDGLVTTEAGGTATFTVQLASQPTAAVTVGLSTNNPAEGAVAPTSLTFTAADWNVAQTVTVTGVNDAVVDGNVAYAIVTAPAVSDDSHYSSLDAADVTVTNQDNDTAGIVVTPTSGLVTTEAGRTATFTVQLTSQPTAAVTVGLSTDNPAEGTVTLASLTFTAADWNVAQTVTVTGADDAIADGNVTYTIITGPAVSSDSQYRGRDAADVLVTNQDDDTAGITVDSASGLATTEAGGTATFTIRLNSQPLAAVTVSLSTSHPAEGAVTPATLMFTAANWNVAQTAMVTGADDWAADGDVPYTIITGPAVSGDNQYSGLDAVDVSVTNEDNDVAGFTVNPAEGLVTSELGGTATFTVQLTSQPAADVTVGLSSNDLTEGTVAPTSLTFTAATWNVSQTVTVTGVDDALGDGNTAYIVVTAPALSADGSYQGQNPADVSVTNQDNDTAGITVNPSGGLVTDEAGATATFTVVLNMQPTATVTIGLSSSNTAEGRLAPTSLSFTAADWNVAQTVTVTGVDDAIADGIVAYAIVTAPAVSDDSHYSGLDAADVTVTNQDNDTPGVTVSPTRGLVTTEAGGTATFTVQLTSQPAATVTVNLSTDNAAEGTVAPMSLTFTAADWNVDQTVTVTGADDAVADGNVTYTIVTGPAVSSDSQYNGRNVADVSVTNQDNDTAGILVTPTSGLVTTEAGGGATFTVQLTSQPTADVTLALSSSNTAEGTVAPASLTFTAVDWNVAQTVTVTGVADAVADGDVAFAIVTAPAVSGDATYRGWDASDVAVTNQAVPPAYHNAARPTDVDASGATAAVDALLIINDLNSNGTRTLPLVRQAGEPYLDVNGDNTVSSVDVLLVIDYLNNQVAGGEGEAPAATSVRRPGLGAAAPVAANPPRPEPLPTAGINEARADHAPPPSPAPGAPGAVVVGLDVRSSHRTRVAAAELLRGSAPRPPRRAQEPPVPADEFLEEILADLVLQERPHDRGPRLSDLVLMELLCET